MFDLIKQASGTLQSYLSRQPAGPDSPIRRRQYTAGDTIYRPGDTAASIFLLEAGRARVFVESPEGKRKTIAYVEPGAYFGELAACGVTQRFEYCQADRTSTIVELPVAELKNLAMQNPNIAYELIGILGRYLKDARMEIDSLVFDPVRERVLRRLVQLVEQRVSPEQLARNEPVTIDITHAQLAMAVGAARETVSTDVEDLKREDVLQIRRGRLEIYPDRLRRALNEEVFRRRRDQFPPAPAGSLPPIPGAPPVIPTPR
jgi:CRP/FNR family transcriptional regulator